MNKGKSKKKQKVRPKKESRAVKKKKKAEDEGEEDEAVEESDEMDEGEEVDYMSGSSRLNFFNNCVIDKSQIRILQNNLRLFIDYFNGHTKTDSLFHLHVLFRGMSKTTFTFFTAKPLNVAVIACLAHGRRRARSFDVYPFVIAMTK